MPHTRVRSLSFRSPRKATRLEPIGRLRGPYRAPASLAFSRWYRRPLPTPVINIRTLVLWSAEIASMSARPTKRLTVTG